MNTTKKSRYSTKSKGQKVGRAVTNFIDDEFQNIVNRKFPGRLDKIMKQRIKTKRYTTESINSNSDFLDIDMENLKSNQIFERTFQRQKKKQQQKTQRISNTKQNLLYKLGIKQQKPYQFFTLTRQTIRSLEKNAPGFEKAKKLARQERQKRGAEVYQYYKLGTSKNSSNKQAFQNKLKLHPYYQIFSRTSKDVCKVRSHTQNYDSFQPFGDLEPIDINEI